MSSGSSSCMISRVEYKSTMTILSLCALPYSYVADNDTLRKLFLSSPYNTDVPEVI